MLDLPDVELRSHGEGLRFRGDATYSGRVRFRLRGVDFRAASTGEAPVYMRARRGVRDRTGEVFPLYCYFDDETTAELRRQRALLLKEHDVEIEGILMHWILGIGVAMIECRLLSVQSPE